MCVTHCDATCTSWTRSKNLFVSRRKLKQNPMLILQLVEERERERTERNALTCHTEGCDVSKL
jgi:hypothetical protein